MPQHDYDLANQTGAAARTDLNDLFEAIATKNSGATEPATTFPFMAWFDTTASLLKIRNAADNAWVTVASLSGTTWIPYRAGSALGGVLDRAVAVVEVVDTTTETTVYTFTVPANALSTNRALRITYAADYLNNSGGNSNLDMKMKFGGTQWAGQSYLALTTSTGRRIIQPSMAMLSAANADDAQVGVSTVTFSNPGGTSGGSVGRFQERHAIHTTLAKDTTTALDLVITVKHSVADAAISFRMHWVQVELV